MCRMRLVVLGGGGFRVPLLHRALLADAANGDGIVDELVLVDTDRSRLDAVLAVLNHQQVNASAARLAVDTTTELDEGLRGADAVFSAIRVGGLTGRVIDEQVARREGVIGQETVGAGGISYALRTIPVVSHIAQRIAAMAPLAWVVNFTNPAGVVTQVMSETLGERVIGICDSPSGLCRRAAHAIGLNPDDVRFDYVGINHLGWLRAMHARGVDLLPQLLADTAALESFDEGTLFGASWLHALGAIPNEYLHYYYFTRELLAADNGRGRAQMLLGQQEEFYNKAPGQPELAHRVWNAALREREQTYFADNRRVVESEVRPNADLAGGGYTEVALAVLRAVLQDKPAQLIVNIRNRGAVPGFNDESVIEVPCLVDRRGARPDRMRAPTDHQAGLLHAVKACEADTIAAAVTGSRRAALRAFASHPLVDSVTVAGRLLDAYLLASPVLAEVLHRP